MIVTCPQCQTRFRIPDDKVTAKGVKVRCTRCRHTFRVSRPAEPVAELPDDPFAQFSPPDALSEEDKTPTRGTPLGDALGVEVESTTAPASEDFDVDVEAPDGKRSPRSPESAPWSFPPPPPRTADAAAPSALASEPEEEPAEPTPRIAFARIATVRQLAVVPAGEAPRRRDPSPPPPPPPVESPPEPPAETFALDAPADDRLEVDTGSLHSAWQGSIEDGLELPPAPSSAEFDFGDLDLEGTSSPVSTPPSYTPPPPPTLPPPAISAAPPAGAFLDFEGLQNTPAPAAPRARAQPPPADDGFADFASERTPAPRSATPSHPALDLSDLDLRSPEAGSEAPVTPGDARTPTGELFGKSATRLDEESFPVGVGATALNTAADRAALFDMPAPAQAQAEEESGPTSLLADVPDAIPDAPVHRSAGLPAVPPTPLRVSRPPAGTSVMGLDERRERGTARRLSGAVVNIGAAAVLVVVLAAVGNVYVNEGRLDWAALSPRRWAALFVPPSGIVTLDVSNGIYETHGGRPLAYVRGRVENRGGQPEQVRVRAEIWDGSQLLGTTEGLAGVLPTPEEMVEAGTRRDVEALRARLQLGAPKLSPGKGTDFVLLFDEPPPETAGLRLKVTASAADGR